MKIAHGSRHLLVKLRAWNSCYIWLIENSVSGKIANKSDNVICANGFKTLFGWVLSSTCTSDTNVEEPVIYFYFCDFI